jgi:hypothetical protein
MLTMHANHLTFTVRNKTLQTHWDNNTDCTLMALFNLKWRAKACDMVLNRVNLGHTVTTNPALKDEAPDWLLGRTIAPSVPHKKSTTQHGQDLSTLVPWFKKQNIPSILSMFDHFFQKNSSIHIYMRKNICENLIGWIKEKGKCHTD